jgi:hypothetical protein
MKSIYGSAEFLCGDFFFCASDASEIIGWAGFTHKKELNPYLSRPTRSLIEIIPFGIPRPYPFLSSSLEGKTPPNQDF